MTKQQFLVVVGFLPELECNFFVQVIICFSFEKHKFSLRKKLVNQLFLSLYFSKFHFLFSSFFILTQKHQKEVSLAQLLRLPLLALILYTGQWDQGFKSAIFCSSKLSKQAEISKAALLWQINQNCVVQGQVELHSFPYHMGLGNTALFRAAS